MAVEKKLLDELIKIRELLEPKEEPKVEKEKPKGLKAKSAKFKDDFLEFIKKYKVMGLAVAFIMALYLGALVQALVDDLIMPILSYIPGIDVIADWAVGPFLLGHFIATLLTFIIVAFVIFLLVKLTSKIGIE
jgi:large conductance mechanosensitive channel